MTAAGDETPVDWDMMMRFGLGVLGLAPRDFWAMTPGEFTAAIQGRLGIGANQNDGIARSALTDLMDRFPDAEKPTERAGS